MRTLALAVVIGLLMATPAQAGWKMRRAQAIAATVWNHPCGDAVKITWGDTGEAAAQTDVVACDVEFSSTEPTDWPPFCTTMIHEYGHLANFRDPLNPGDPYHSHTPTSVMYAHPLFDKHIVHVAGGRTTTTWTGVDRRCARNGRPYLEKHGLLSRRTTRPSSAPGPSRRAAARPTGH